MIFMEAGKVFSSNDLGVLGEGKLECTERWSDETVFPVTIWKNPLDEIP